jgi:hypothetical protein
LALVALSAALPAQAQTRQAPLASLLLNFFSPSNPVVLKDNPVPQFSHAAHFMSQPGATETLRGLNSGIASQLSTFPIGSSSGGFTYTFDESLGVYNRTTQSFGPIFTERPLTTGKGKFTFGVNYQQATYDSFQGKDLSGGDLTLYLLHLDVNHDGSNLNPWFEGDIIRANLSIDLDVKTTVLFANFGASERLDVGVALPFQDVSLSARIDTNIERLATGSDPFVVHVFDDNTSEHAFVESGSASGIGDLLVRGKYNFLRRPHGSLAAALDLRLPTGDENDLLGSGATQAKLFVIAGGAPGRFSPRGSFGYTFSNGGSDFTGDLPDEIYYTAGFDVVPHRRVSLAADFIGRTLLNTDKVVDHTSVFQYRTRTDPTVLQTTRQELATEKGNLNLMLGSVGIKINPVGRLLLVVNALFKIGNNGLQDDLTPTFGIDYTF